MIGTLWNRRDVIIGILVTAQRPLGIRWSMKNIVVRPLLGLKKTMRIIQLEDLRYIDLVGEVLIAAMTRIIEIEYPLQPGNMGAGGVCTIIINRWRYTIQLEPDACSAWPSICRSGIASNLSPPTAFTGSHH